MIVVGGELAGRLHIFRSDGEFRILDISLLPKFRGAGIGGTPLAALIEEARAGGKSVRLHVKRLNPARRLYERLGFQVVSDSGPYLMMECAAQ